ncbi:hypothetical protein C2845_PM01G48840 [Panicum miliaceum]|uniref:4-hydroxyphenylacetaldehyde oxime monooxygenase-like n=1 Tax=Panicum miliaceum TaxID=4540 RepID=A0A3L6TPE4_PANMI|nr:hypothetical protein C2845_PM01G48840 [Panicum miliaceum]
MAAVPVLDCSLPQQWQLMTLLPMLFLLLLAAAARRRSWGRKGRRCLHLPPGPPRLPILGNLHQLGALPHQSLRDLARRHGPAMLLRLGSVPTLVVSSAEAAREVMKVRDVDCCSRPDTPGARRLSYGHKDVAFAPYSEYWREMRKLFVVEFLSARRVEASRYAREAEVEKLIGRLSRAGGTPVLLEDHIFALMDGVIGTVAFGNIYGTEQFAHRKHFHDVLDEAMSAKAGFSAEDYYPNAVGRLVDRFTGTAARRERVFRDLDAFFDVIIDQHLDPSRAAPEKGPDLIDAFVALFMKENGSVVSFTRDNIKGLLSNVFTASVDTSSVTMVWAMAELIRRPAMLRKVQEGIRAAVGDDKERVHPDDMPKLRYLKMVVKETLRLHPAVPLLLPRETLRHVGICGYDVPARTRILVNAWAIGRDPASWDDPEEFDPGRFDQGNKDGVGFNGTHFELVPFGAGRRMCPGMALGVATTEFTLANLLYCFDWALPEGMAPEEVSMEEAGGLTVHKKTPLVLVPTRYNPSANNNAS